MSELAAVWLYCSCTTVSLALSTLPNIEGGLSWRAIVYATACVTMGPLGTIAFSVRVINWRRE